MVVEKLDLSKVDTAYYKAGKMPEIKELLPYNYLTISGQSAPDTPQFLKAIETLYQVAYGVKFLSKAEDDDFVVPKMEGFWWIYGGVEDQAEFENTPQDQWFWKIVIRMPAFIRQDHFIRAMEIVKFKKSPDNIDQLRFEEINEGKCAQILHIGSYSNEKATIEKLHQFVADQGLKISGYHHEIYITDPRRTSEEKLKTILRYAVR